MATINSKMLIKRTTKAKLPKKLPIGELCYCTDVNELYIGDEEGNILINDNIGERGKSLEFIWKGTKLGIRVEGEPKFKFVELSVQNVVNDKVDSIILSINNMTSDIRNIKNKAAVTDQRITDMSTEIADLKKKLKDLEENRPVDPGPDEPDPPTPSDNEYIYYGIIPFAATGGSYGAEGHKKYTELTENMLKDSRSRITKIKAQTLGKTSLGKESTTASADYTIVLVPEDSDYVVTMDNGLGGKVQFNEEICGPEFGQMGANGNAIMVVDKVRYRVYGVYLISPSEIFIYVD